VTQLPRLGSSHGSCGSGNEADKQATSN
jgi:hypothetical protein